MATDNEKVQKPTDPTKELGMSYDPSRSKDDFLPQLRSDKAFKKYDEMRQNDSVVGAFLLAMNMLIRRVTWKVQPADESPEAVEMAEFVESCLGDMDITFEDFISNALTFLPFGYSFFEKVYKKRNGQVKDDPFSSSQYTDGRIGIKKLAYRPQTSIRDQKFSQNGDLLAMVQDTSAGTVVIPLSKGLMFRATGAAESPLGKSMLRNAFVPYHRLSNFQDIESIAVERELNGLPVGRIPADYLASDASSEQKQLKRDFEKALRDVKLNDQGFLLLPSDTYPNTDGSPSSIRMMDIELIASQGTRAIDIGATISRYQTDVARTVLADFIMLGQNSTGSFALSKDKSELFLLSLQGHVQSIAAVLNRHLTPELWELNGFNPDLKPTIEPDDVAPVDLDELGNYITRLAGAGAPLFPSQKLTNTLLHIAGLPEQAPEDNPLPDAPDPAELSSVADALMNQNSGATSHTSSGILDGSAGLNGAGNDQAE